MMYIYHLKLCMSVSELSVTYKTTNFILLMITNMIQKPNKYVIYKGTSKGG